jgi:peptide-methionine (S)-S-oxide reductase
MSRLTRFASSLIVIVGGLAVMALIVFNGGGLRTSAQEETMADGLEVATFGTGCFWCTEAIFQELEGVIEVVSGYSGGTVPNPSYAQVCTGETGHAEVVQITFDPRKIGYADLLTVFWRVHDPTTLNRQGNDVGTQYRSVIFYHDDEQRRLAEASKRAAESAGLWEDPIVTEIVPLKAFYPAEPYHQDYYRRNPKQGYCVYVIEPKLRKFRKIFAQMLRESERGAEGS